MKVQLRTGNTKEPDDTWASFSTALLGDEVIGDLAFHLRIGGLLRPAA